MPQRPPTCATVIHQAMCSPALQTCRLAQFASQRLARLRIPRPTATSGVLACLVLGIAPACSLAAGPGLAMSDSALIAHIKKTDYVFSVAFGRCSAEKLTRHREGQTEQFEYAAFCSARAAQESDCPGFDVKAQGTVDSPTWATVRTQTLKLKCAG